MSDILQKFPGFLKESEAMIADLKPLAPDQWRALLQAHRTALLDFSRPMSFLFWGRLLGTYLGMEVRAGFILYSFQIQEGFWAWKFEPAEEDGQSMGWIFAERPLPEPVEGFGVCVVGCVDHVHEPWFALLLVCRQILKDRAQEQEAQLWDYQRCPEIG